MNPGRSWTGTDGFEQNMRGISATFAIGGTVVSGSNVIFIRAGLITKLFAVATRSV
jgi:hypothetical protein